MANFVESSCVLKFPHPGGGSAQGYGNMVCWDHLNITVATDDGAKLLKARSFSKKSDGEFYMILSTDQSVEPSAAAEDTTAETKDLAADEYRARIKFENFTGTNETAYSPEALFKGTSYGLRWYLKGVPHENRYFTVTFDNAKKPSIVMFDVNITQNPKGSVLFDGRVAYSDSSGHMSMLCAKKLSMLVSRPDGLYTMSGDTNYDGTIVTTDKEQTITAQKTFDVPPKITAPATEPEHAVNRAYIDSIISAKEPFNCAITLHAAAASANAWVVMSNLEISLANGKKLKCLHVDNTQPTNATEPVKCVFGLVEESAAIDAAPEKHEAAFFTTYQLKENELWGSVTYGKLLDKQWSEYSSYSAPFFSAQYGAQGAGTDLKPLLRIGIEEAPAAVKKMKLTWDGSYLPSKAQASLDGCGLPVSSKLYESVTAGEMEIPFDLVKLTGLVTLDSAQTITGAKSFTVLPKSKVDPDKPEDFVNKKYADYIAEQTLTNAFGTGPYNCNLTLDINDGNKWWVRLYKVEFHLDDGKKLKCIHCDEVMAANATEPVRCVYKVVEESEAFAEPEWHPASFFDSYELKEGELWGSVTYGPQLDPKWSTQTAYRAPFSTTTWYGVHRDDGVLAPAIKFGIEKCPAAIAKVSVYWDPSYRSTEAQATLRGCGAAVSSPLLTTPTGDHDMPFKLLDICTLGTEQELTAKKTFKVLPQSEATPADAKDLATKKYVDEKVAAGGGGGSAGTPPANMVTTDTDQSITAVKTFTKLPKSDAVPADNAELVNKKYVDDKQGKVVTLDTEQTIAAVKTFGKLPKSTAEPADDAELVTKKYVDAKVAAGGGSGAAPGNMVTTDTAQTITGVKTFSTLPQSEALPKRKQDFTTKKYITQSCVMLEGDQTIAGIKTFNALPQSTATPTLNEEFTTKKYVDGLVTSGTSELQIYGSQGWSTRNLGFREMQVVLLDGRYLNPKYVVADGNNEASYVALTPIIYEVSDTPLAPNNDPTIMRPDKFNELLNWPKQLVGYMYTGLPSLHDSIKDHIYDYWGVQKSYITSFARRCICKWKAPSHNNQNPKSNIPYSVMGYIFPESPVPIHYVQLKNDESEGFLFKSRVGNTLYMTDLITPQDSKYSDLWSLDQNTYVIKAFLNPNLRHLASHNTIKALEDRIKKLEDAAAPKP